MLDEALNTTATMTSMAKNEMGVAMDVEKT